MKHARDGTTNYSTLALLFAANLLIAISIVVFATGFFPYKPLLPGLASYDEALDSEYGLPPSAPFDRVVLMVVDALRSDFVYSHDSGFKFTQSLIGDGYAIPFTAHATSPTVTMPRIKAITTGSIPSFVDVILNINEGESSSSLASHDTWLAQMKAKHTGKLVMYGDDTWLKLFPGFFDRADGTSSFFVADFTEVDNNVTRHIADELENRDWTAMVLHYLGLDHIGHKGGPRSANMLPKQVEMDGIVKQLYAAIESRHHLQSTLLILLGDHGMNDAGNHGGSAPGETSPALVFMSPKMKSLNRTFEVPMKIQEDFKYYTMIEQSDIAPTLGGLLGFPTPKNNRGAFIADFLALWSHKNDQIQILMRNAHQILAIITATFGEELFDATGSAEPCLHKEESGVQKLACDWSALSNKDSNEIDDEWILAMSQWLKDAQGVLGSLASNYGMPRLVLGQAAAIAATLLAIHVGMHVGSGWRRSTGAVPFALITSAYGVMMFASSYVEEEHQFWYYATTTWLAFISSKGFQGTSKSGLRHAAAALTVATVTRIIRSWNRTGQKFAGDPDIVKSFIVIEPVRIWILISIAYVWIHRRLLRGLLEGLPTVLSIAGSTGLVFAGFTFKLAFTNEDAPELVTSLGRSLVDLTNGPSLVARARAVFVGTGLAAACVVLSVARQRKISRQQQPAVETLHHLYTLLAMTQSRATNIPLFLLFDMQYEFLAAQPLTLAELSTASILLQYMSFFALGGTNAISSVDLSSAYNGVRHFDIPTVGLLTFVSNWAAPIYWMSAINTLLVRKRMAGLETAVFTRHVTLLTVFAATHVGFVMAACTALRTHLFIWSVFSPKYLYCMAWTLAQHLVVNVGLGGMLYWLGSINTLT